MGGRYKGALAEVTSSSSKAKGQCACLSATSSSLVTVSPWLRTPHSFRHGSSGFLLSLLPQPLRLPGLSSPSSWVTSAPPRLPAAGLHYIYSRQTRRLTFRAFSYLLHTSSCPSPGHRTSSVFDINASTTLGASYCSKSPADWVRSQHSSLTLSSSLNTTKTYRACLLNIP